ncbi:MAG: Na(+)-translocating NADH-quinone reductase subunit A [Oligoflexales bacterium]
MIRIKNGLNIPLLGSPSSQVDEGAKVRTVAALGVDFIGMKPTMAVNPGDQVKIGQKLFECKKNPGLIFTSPAAGTVKSVKRGEKRAFQLIDIDVAETEEHVEFQNYSGKNVCDLDEAQIRALLIESGLWTAFRSRPFEKTVSIDGTTESIFVTAMDTNPHAPDASIVLQGRESDFESGLQALAKLCSKKVLVCHAGKVSIPQIDKVENHVFDGVHPAGNVGTHIHYLDPVNPSKHVWHISYQDVVAVGSLITTGKLDLQRVVTLAGPLVKNPRYLKTRLGACLDDLTQGELDESCPVRVISGSVLHGRTRDDVFKYLGRYATQVSAVEEDRKREFLGWHTPGWDRFSVKNIYLSKLRSGLRFAMTSSTHGSPRSLVPLGAFEKVTALDILPTQLLRALLSRDTESAQDLGCLELAEEDVALYTFVSTGKTDFGPVLRENLTTIEKEG